MSDDDDLPLPQICTTALNLRRTQQQHDRDEAGPAWQADKLVFTARYGTPIEPRNFNRSWDARCAKADVRKITVHDGRRSCGTLLADLDVPPRVAMQILRHADFALTREIYTLASSAQPQRASPTRPAAPSTVGQLAHQVCRLLAAAYPGAPTSWWGVIAAVAGIGTEPTGDIAGYQQAAPGHVGRWQLVPPAPTPVKVVGDGLGHTARPASFADVAPVPVSPGVSQPHRQSPRTTHAHGSLPREAIDGWHGSSHTNRPG